MAVVRLKDIAAEVGVSVGAVGWVMNGMPDSTIKVSPANVKRIREAAERLGYRVNYAARQLRGGASGIIGVITHEAASQEDLDRMISIEQAAAAEGLHMMIATLSEGGVFQEQVTDTFTRFATRGVDGVIALLWKLLDADPVLFQGLPVTFIGPSILMPGRAGVCIDAEEGGRLAVQHLVARGKRRIGFALEKNAYARSRLAGAREVLAAHGIPLDEHAIIQQGLDHYGGDAQAEAHVARLVDERHVDAIVAENDHWAARMLEALRRRGISVPETIAIVGYNNLRFCEYMSPPLTSVAEQEQDIATAAVSALQRLINQPKGDPDCPVIKPKLVIREST